MKNSNIQFIMTGELADLLSVKPVTVRRWAKTKKIPSVILPSGRRVFNPMEVVDALKKSELKDIDIDKILLAYEKLRAFLHSGTTESKK